MSSPGLLFTSVVMPKPNGWELMLRGACPPGRRSRQDRYEARRRGLQLALRYKTPALVEELAALGFTARTVSLEELVPVLQVAWATGRVARRARALIVAWAEEAELSDVALKRLELHLRFRADDAFFRRTLAVLGQLYQLCPAAEGARARRRLQQRVALVSRLGRGWLGLLTGLPPRARRRAVRDIERRLSLPEASPEPPGPCSDGLGFLELEPIDADTPVSQHRAWGDGGDAALEGELLDGEDHALDVTTRWRDAPGPSMP